MYDAIFLQYIIMWLRGQLIPLYFGRYGTLNFSRSTTFGTNISCINAEGRETFDNPYSIVQQLIILRPGRTSSRDNDLTRWSRNVLSHRLTRGTLRIKQHLRRIRETERHYLGSSVHHVRKLSSILSIRSLRCPSLHILKSRVVRWVG